MDAFDQAINPDAAAIARMRFGSNAAIAGELLDVAGAQAVDIGCGEGKFTRLLAARGARIVGVDVNEAALAKARAAAAEEGLAIEFRHASGEALPFDDASLDLVVFSNSLHHVARIDEALQEARRALRPGGTLYVMEPVAAGPYHEATKLVHDESAVRTAAYAALRRAGDAGFQPLHEVCYRARRRFGRYEDWRDEQVARGEKRRALFAQHEGEIRTRFETHADRSDGGFAFDQIFRVNLLRKPDEPACTFSRL